MNWKRREKRMAKNEVDLEGLTKEEIAEIRKAELEIKNSKEFKVGLSPSRPVESRWNPNEEEYYKYKETWTHGITCAFQLSEEWMGGNNHFVLKIFGHEGLPDIESPEFEFPGADARDIVVLKLVKSQNAGITATIGRVTWDEMHKHLVVGVPLYRHPHFQLQPYPYHLRQNPLNNRENNQQQQQQQHEQQQLQLQLLHAQYQQQHPMAGIMQGIGMPPPPPTAGETETRVDLWPYEGGHGHEFGPPMGDHEWQQSRKYWKEIMDKDTSNKEGLNNEKEMDLDQFAKGLLAEQSPTRDKHEVVEGPLTSAAGQMDKGKSVMIEETAGNIGNQQHPQIQQQYAGTSSSFYPNISRHHVGQPSASSNSNFLPPPPPFLPNPLGHHQQQQQQDQGHFSSSNHPAIDHLEEQQPPKGHPSEGL